jgi:hypothetical protein
MDCRDVAERLPWYLNGTLPAAERDPLQAHVEGCDQCREELSQTRRLRALLGAHPPSDAIVAFAAEETVEGQGADARRAHFAMCAECQEELALARESARAVENPPAVSAPATGPRAAWSARTAAAAAAILVSGILVGHLMPQRATSDGGQIAALVAENARLRGDAARAGALQNRLDEALAPQKNVAVVQLLPQRGAFRGTPGAPGSAPRGDGHLTLTRGGPYAVVSLIYESAPRWDDYRVEIADPAATVVWRADGLVRQPEGDFTVLVPTASLKDGSHELHLCGRRGESWTRLATYRLDVRNTPQR